MRFISWQDIVGFFKKAKVGGGGKTLIIESISACQVCCDWCAMQKYQKHKMGMMPIEKFRKIITSNKKFLLKNNYVVEPYFRGEPLLHPDFWEFCRVLKENNIPNGGINTNLSLNIDVEKFLEYQPMWPLVNLGGTTKEVHESVMLNSNWELVTNNLRKMYAKNIPALVKINPTKKNYKQIKDLPDFIESLGGKREYAFDYTTSFVINYAMSKEETDIFFENVVCEEINDRLRFTYDLSKADKAIKSKKPGCHFLFDTILFDGQFTICCHDQLGEINLGNAFEISLEEIIDSEEYKGTVERGKKQQLIICKECN